MTHEELLAKIDECPVDNWVDLEGNKHAIIREMTDWQLALRSVVELHKPARTTMLSNERVCDGCDVHDNYYSSMWPCPTIQAIEKELD